METIGDSRLRTAPGARAADSHVPAQALAPLLEEAARLVRSRPFRPHPRFANGHAQTIYAALAPRRDEPDAPHGVRRESRLFEVEPGVRVRLECRWQERPQDGPTVIIIHGLEGSADSHYVRGTAAKAVAAGFNAVGFNMRNCGGTEHLTPTLYHSGLTSDIHRVLVGLAEQDGLAEIYLAGFSMSGNMVLKLAGEYRGEVPSALGGVAAVSPSIELNACAAHIERRANWLYRQSFMRSLRRRVRKKRALYPDLYDTRGLWRVRTVRQFDERFTAPAGGYADATDYYDRASSLPVIADIRVPTLVLHAEDDPIIPAAPFREPFIAANPDVLLVLTRRGGHVGFVADPAAAAGEDARWAENRVVEFFRLLSQTRAGAASPAGGPAPGAATDSTAGGGRAD
ncbi:MAG TPA: alpha/beta fold hydrolase [Pyrinomonadaceae bacterium]|nr:alpha/beta fold hydrolase [Pyrinomonadaceae bacterium]